MQTPDCHRSNFLICEKREKLGRKTEMNSEEGDAIGEGEDKDNNNQTDNDEDQDNNNNKDAE